MKRLILLLLLSLLLPACQRGGNAEDPTDPNLEPLPTLTASSESDGFDLPDLGGNELPTATAEGEVAPLPTTETLPTAEILPTAEATAPTAQQGFTNLRFASSPNGFEQSAFPAGTEEVYAIWDYQGLQEGATMERLWYHNGELYVERREPWDFPKYGASGTVRDIYLYDYRGGLFPGQWRVEIYLNGEQQLVGEFSVAAQ